MRLGRAGAVLAALALLGGCANTAAQQAGPVADVRAPGVACTTTYLVLATVSKCGAGGLKFGVATE